jgi:hypothetical protein
MKSKDFTGMKGGGGVPKTATPNLGSQKGAKIATPNDSIKKAGGGNKK